MRAFLVVAVVSLAGLVAVVGVTLARLHRAVWQDHLEASE